MGSGITLSPKSPGSEHIYLNKNFVIIRFIYYIILNYNKTNLMKISIVIPTRNRPKLLKKTLENLSKNNFFLRNNNS